MEDYRQIVVMCYAETITQLIHLFVTRQKNAVQKTMFPVTKINHQPPTSNSNEAKCNSTQLCCVPL